ncbi:hypothetical protein DNTS_009474 [Danionella cerebrum]|uniref:Uncharacterized protein n=1 Tax=Danionella cerebrum TaxID=2873325 RepID=A0A553PWV7_9TELE|nr:hypothetical protein DNTS_009474 [Danionella translucida]
MIAAHRESDRCSRPVENQEPEAFPEAPDEPLELQDLPPLPPSSHRDKGSWLKEGEEPLWKDLVELHCSAVLHSSPQGVSPSSGAPHTMGGATMVKRRATLALTPLKRASHLLASADHLQDCDWRSPLTESLSVCECVLKHRVLPTDLLCEHTLVRITAASMWILLASIFLLHLACIALLLAATIHNAWWWVKDSLSTDLWGRWVLIGGNWNFTQIPDNYPREYLQAVQASSVLACVFSVLALIVFVAQLYTLPKGKRFLFTGAFQMLSCNSNTLTPSGRGQETVESNVRVKIEGRGYV